MADTRSFTQMSNCKVGDTAVYQSSRAEYNGCVVKCVREVTQEELVTSGISLDEAPFWDTGLTVKRKGSTIQVWVSDKKLKPL